MKKVRHTKVTFGKNFPDRHLYDYMVYDQVTGYKVWRSECVFLDKYTGKGGLLTHRDVANKIYTIDYGLVPYKIPAEMPIPDTAVNHTYPLTDNAGDTTFYWENILQAQENNNIITSDGYNILLGTDNAE